MEVKDYPAGANRAAIHPGMHKGSFAPLRAGSALIKAGKVADSEGHIRSFMQRAC